MVQKIKKYKNKILSFLVAIVALPFLTVNSFAVDVSPDLENEWFLLPFNQIDDLSQKGEFDSVLGTFNSSGGSYSGRYRHFSVSTDTSAVMPVFEAGGSYLIYATFVSVGSQSGSISAGSIRYNWGDWSGSLPLVSSNIIHNSSNYANGTNTYTTIWQLSNIYATHIISTASQLQLDFGSSITTEGRVGWAFYALDITNTSESEVNSIVSAINNQTSQLGSQLGNIDGSIQQGNEIAENGNETTQENVTEFTEVFEDFNAELDEIESFDDEIIGEFEAANTEYLTTLNNFELTHSVLNAGNWLATSMQTIYDSSSDFKMLWLVPMIFGIPILLFIGKKIKGDDE